MRLEGWMSGAEFAFLFRTSAALGAGHGQDLSQRELFGFHCDIIQHGQFESWSILLGGFREISSKLQTGQICLGEDENAGFRAAIALRS
jgi:hypothetical protein